MIAIDFETRSKVDLTKIGAWLYSLHESTEPLCLCWCKDDGPVRLWIPNCEVKDFRIPELDDHMPSELMHALMSRDLVEAHNAFFERAIWRNIMVPRYKWMDIPDHQWSCSAAKAASHALPRKLETVAAALGLEHQKDTDGHRVMLQCSRPRRPSKHNPNEWFDDEPRLKTVYEYCRQDVAVERELSRKLDDLSPQEREVWLLDQKINERGVRVDLEMCHAAIDIIGQRKKELSVLLSHYTHGECSTITRVQAIREYLHNTCLDLPNLDKKTIRHTLKRSDLSERHRKVLEVREEASKTSVAKYKKILDSVAPDGRLRDLLMYHGASTGRWSGKLVQPQNFPRNTYKGDLEEYVATLKTRNLMAVKGLGKNVLGGLSQCLRGVFIPSAGHRFFGGDYSGIELRVALWLAGDPAIKRVAAGEDLYVNLARRIYKTDTVTPHQRSLGKVGMLSRIYWVGATKLKRTCHEIYDLDISMEEATGIVNAFNAEHISVINFAKDQIRSAMYVVGNPSKAIEASGITWVMDGDYLRCRLPSGRTLRYYKPEIQKLELPWSTEHQPALADTLTYMSVNSVTRKWERTATHGGKINENIVSGVARDILAAAILRCEMVGYKVVLTVHDEVVCEKESGSEEEFKSLMEAPLDWAEGLPIDAEVWSGMRYLK